MTEYTMNELMRNAYECALLDGATIEKNRVTIYQHKGLTRRWQVYSDRAGKRFDDVFIELNGAITKFLELSN